MRPRDRKTQLSQAASELLQKRGFAGVSMKDVAAAVGLTAPAIYRHFPNKQGLLASVISDGLAAAEAAVDGTESRGIATVTHQLAIAAVDKYDLWLLLHRESGNLSAQTRRELQDRFALLTRRIATIIATERPTETVDTELLALAVLASLSAPSQYRLRSSRDAATTALTGSANRVAHCDLPVLHGPTTWMVHPRSGPFKPEFDRRESLLHASATLFAERGYPSVTLEDIGAAVSMAGPSVYNHFRSKHEILAGVLWRSVDWMEMDFARAMNSGTSPDDVLRLLFDSYADLALRHPHMLRVLVNEAIHLSPDEHERIGRAHDDFVERWGALLRRTNPNLTADAARIQVSAGLCVVNELSQLPRFRGNPGNRQLLAGLAIPALEL